MTYSFTQTSTFTRTHARYLASKVAADLRQMQRLYGRPTDDSIEDYIDELITLLTEGYLESAEYGFQKDKIWIVALRYVVRPDGSIVNDDRPGRVPVGANVAGATWYSYLRHNQKWHDLDENHRQDIQSRLPFKRTPAPEPQTGNAYWRDDKSYSKANVSLARGSFYSQ